MLYLILSLFFSFYVEAMVIEKVNILKKSSTGKTLVLNLGKDQLLNESEEAEFFEKVSVDGLRFKFSGKLIKVLDNQSYWLVNKAKGQGIPDVMYLVRRSQSGKAPLQVHAKSIQKTQSQSKEFTKMSEKKGNPLDLVFGEDAYYASDNVKETEPIYNHDLEFVQLKTMYPDGKDHHTKKPYYIVESLPSSPIVKKTVREIEENIIRKNTQLSLKEKDVLDSLPKETEAIERPSDTSSYSDEGLRQYFLSTELKKERLRYENSKDQQKSHEILISYSSAFNKSATNTDEGSAGYNSSYSLSYEYYLMKTWERLRSLSLEIGAGQGTYYYAAGSANSKMENLHFKAYVNWYFLNSPASVSRYMGYVGTGFKRGVASVSPSTSQSSYDYDVLSIPGFQAGIKYRFSQKPSDPVGLGFHFSILHEVLNFSSTGTIEEGMLSSFSFSDTQFGLGMNIYF